MDVAGKTQKKIVSFFNNLIDASIGAVGLVNEQDHWKLGFESLAKHETSLRQWALGCIDEQNNAVNHRETALNLATEVGVARGVDHVDGDFLATRSGALVRNGGVLGENGDSLFAL